MPSISSKDIQYSEPLISVVKTEPIIEKKKELTLIDLFKLPENKELTLCFEDGTGEWTISNCGYKLSRIPQDVTLPRIDSYFCTHRREVGEIVYFMTNGHTFVIGYCEKGIKFEYSYPGSLYNHAIYKKYEWRKL